MINLKLTPTARALMAADIIGNPLAGVPTPSLDLDFVNSSTLDSRITFSRASSATYFDSSGVLQTAASGVARFDHNPTTLARLGLLIEEQRTNSIRNNTMQGAVAGTPGTAPTNWTGSTTISGLAREIVGIGIEDGVDYIDVRFSGTTTAALNGAQLISPAGFTNAASASVGQTWTQSVFAYLISGSFTNVTQIAFDVVEINSVGTSVAAGGSFSILSNTSGPLKNNRLAGTRTLANATVSIVGQRLILTASSGAAIDFTLRIGLPQLEQGAFATSVIPTTTAAATRNADVASMTGTNFSSWYSASEGTLYAEYSIPFDSSESIFPLVFTIDDGSNNNRISIQNRTIDDKAAGVARANATLQLECISSQTFSYGTTQKTIFGYALNNAALSLNGAAVTTDTSGTLPSNLNVARIGNNVGGYNNYLNGTIRKIAYWPVRLENAQLQALTR